MNKIIQVIVLLFVPALLTAQSREIFDLVSYQPPAGWKKQEKEGMISYITTDIQKGGYCILSLYKSESSTGSLPSDFSKYWIERVVTPFGVKEDPATEKSPSSNGWEALSAAAAFKTEQNEGTVLLTTMTGHGMRTSILILLNSADYMADIQHFLESVEMKVPEKKAAPINASLKIVGKWAKSSSSPPEYHNGTLINLVDAGYHKGQYEFKSDGTYIFYGESKFGVNSFGITTETGTYSISGNQLVIRPGASQRKKVDLNGNFKKLEKLPLASRTYQWELHYFEGIGETQLALTGVAQNNIDGGFVGNALFPSSFLYSQDYKPEWRYK